MDIGFRMQILLNYIIILHLSNALDKIFIDKSIII